MNKETQKKAADVLLEKKVRVTIGKKDYTIPPPSIATMAIASRAILQLPNVNTGTDDIVSESLRVARDCEIVGDIIAIFLVGAKDLREGQNSFFGFIKQRLAKKRKEALSRMIVEELRPSELHAILATIFTTMEVADFFSVIASLTRINNLAPAGEAMKTTAHGQS